MKKSIFISFAILLLISALALADNIPIEVKKYEKAHNVTCLPDTELSRCELITCEKEHCFTCYYAYRCSDSKIIRVIKEGKCCRK